MPSLTRTFLRPLLALAFGAAALSASAQTLRIGLAEDPGTGESFGMHRSRLLADGLLRAHEHRLRTAAARLPVVVERFAEDGLDLQRPFLCPGSGDDYALPVRR